MRFYKSIGNNVLSAKILAILGLIIVGDAYVTPKLKFKAG